MSFSIDNINSSGISWSYSKIIHQSGRESNLSALVFELQASLTTPLRQIEKAMSRDSKLFQQPLLHVLFFYHRMLTRLHLQSERRHSPVTFSLSLEHTIFR